MQRGQAWRLDRASAEGKVKEKQNRKAEQKQNRKVEQNQNRKVEQNQNHAERNKAPVYRRTWRMGRDQLQGLQRQQAALGLRTDPFALGAG